MRTGRLVRALAAGLVSLIPAALGAPAAEPAPEFGRDLAPLLRQRCVRCHRPENRHGGLSLATPADLRARGLLNLKRPGESRLVAAVRSADGVRPRMPKEGAPLTTAQVDALQRWIAAGAPWPEGLVLREQAVADRSWWSLRPLRPVAPPEAAGIPAGWKQNPIDRFIYTSLAARGLRPSPAADRRTLIRRVAYDLTGLPPTPEEIDSFLNDRAPGAYERVVDRLLASPAYGEQWGRHWLDVVRFGESRGYERNEIVTNAWPFRDYVIRAFNEDRSYRQLILEHLAGDVLSPGDPAVEAGVTFLTCGPYDDVGNQDPVQAATIRANTLDDMIRATGETFLGMTVGCARCHDHKFDPVPTQDYYRLYATFAGVRHGSREIATPAQREERERALEPLRDELRRVEHRRDGLEEAVLERARGRAAALEAMWTRPAPGHARIEERFPPVRAAAVRLVVEASSHSPSARTGYHIDEFEAWTPGPGGRNAAAASAGARAQGASRVAEDFGDAYSVSQAIDGQVGAAWIAEGPTLTVSFAAPATIDRVVFSSNRHSPYGKPFPADYRIEVSPDGSDWAAVASSADRKPVSPGHRRRRLMEAEIGGAERRELEELAAQQEAIRQHISAVPALPVWWAGQFEQPRDPVRVFLGGDPRKPGDEAPPGSPTLLQDSFRTYTLLPDAKEGDRRLALARWIADPQNPLTPRVMVNRVWHYHFGTGIVDTPSDFGAMGGRPSHPQLLDWLAARFWGPQMNGRLKPLHRLIVTSSAYRQSSAFRADAARVDARSRLLWRFPPRRLTAEELRDTLLAVSGRLDRRAGGPGFRLYRYLQDNVATYVPLDRPGPDTYRRAVYHHNARAAFVDVLSDFDCPDNAFGAPRREATTTPLQALTLLNHAFTLDMARHLAERLEREVPGEDHAARVTLGFRLAFGRSPTAEERAEAVAAARGQGLRALCRALLNASELIYLD